MTFRPIQFFLVAICALAGFWPPSGKAGDAASTADVVISKRLAHGSYIVGESVQCELRIENRGPFPLVLEDSPFYRDNRLFFEIIRHPDRTLHPFSPQGMLASFMLMPGEETTLRFNLADHYPLDRKGRYFVTAVFQAGRQQFKTPVRMLDVVAGLELDRVTMVLPDDPGVRRTYRLVYWARGQAEHLFLRAADAPGERILRTVSLGPVIRTSSPKLRVDRQGTVRIRHQVNRDQDALTVLESRSDGLRLVDRSLVRRRPASALPSVPGSAGIAPERDGRKRTAE